jgi:hypothetical protein
MIGSEERSVCVRNYGESHFSSRGGIVLHQMWVPVTLDFLVS